MKLECKGFTDKGPARAANILPVKAPHTTGCLKELKTVPNLHMCRRNVSCQQQTRCKSACKQFPPTIPPPGRQADVNV